VGHAIAMSMLGLAATVLFGAGAVWLQRYARRELVGRASPLPQAKINDGRGFGRAPIEGRRRAGLAVARFYIVMLWLLALISLLGGAIAPIALFALT
jgi:hypothetical protein